MKAEPLKRIPDLILVEPVLRTDERGSFFESWNEKKFADAVGFTPNFIQDNQSTSHKGVVRGLHYQTAPFAQAKLVRVGGGAVFDVAVDLRRDSDTFGQWDGALLSEDNMKQLWIPEGFAHGFMALTENVKFLYKVAGGEWSPPHERALLWNDAEIGINWPDAGLAPIINQKDSEAPSWRETKAAILRGDFTL